MTMRMIDKFCRTDFTSYEDFKQNFRISVPDRFNYAFDVVDEIAARRPDKTALVWCNDQRCV